MASRKYYMIAKFETKEDFDKHFRGIYKHGYNAGVEDGRIDLLADLLNFIDDLFGDMKDDQIHDAQYRAKKKGIIAWKKRQEFYEGIKKSAIEEYKKSLETNTEP